MIEYLKWMTYSVLPLVYDESLSYVELLNKVVAKLNEVITETNDLSKHMDTVISEWLETDTAQKAVEDAVGKFIETYSKTESFHDVLVEALSSQSEEISTAATQAAKNWLDSDDGKNAVNADVVDYMTAYVLSTDFKTLVQSYLDELSDIKRGTVLDIRQKTNVSISAPVVNITGTSVSDDYSTKAGYDVMVTSGGIRVDAPTVEKAIVIGTEEGGVLMKYPVAWANNDGIIYGLKAPVVGTAAANKDYVDSKISSSQGAVVGALSQSSETGAYSCDKTFAELYSAYPNVFVYKPNAQYAEVATPVSVSTTTMKFRATTWMPASDGQLGLALWTYTVTSGNKWTSELAQYSTLSYIQTGGATNFQANQSMGGNKLTNLGTPTANTDAATKQYVDTAGVYTITGGFTLSNDGMPNTVTGINYGDIAAVADRYASIRLLLTLDTSEETQLVMDLAAVDYVASTAPTRKTWVFKGIWLSNNYTMYDNKRAVVTLTFSTSDDTSLVKPFRMFYEGRRNNAEVFCESVTDSDGVITGIYVGQDIDTDEFVDLAANNSNVVLWIARGNKGYVRGTCVEWFGGATSPTLVWEVVYYDETNTVTIRDLWKFDTSTNKFSKLG